MKEKLLDNIGYKVLAVAMAVALWLFVSFRGQSDIVIEAPIEFRNLPVGLEILKQNVRRVNVSIQGHEQILNRIRNEDAKVIVDLGSGKRGEATYYFDVSDVKSSKAFKVLRLDPTYVRVTLDELRSARVTVHPIVVGSPRQGYVVKSVSAEPVAVEVEGARSEIDRVTVLRTEPMDITGLDSDITQNMRIDAGGKNIRLKTADVAVKVAIGRR